jgi:hypothetical protein
MGRVSGAVGPDPQRGIRIRHNDSESIVGWYRTRIESWYSLGVVWGTLVFVVRGKHNMHRDMCRLPVSVGNE